MPDFYLHGGRSRSRVEVTFLLQNFSAAGIEWRLSKVAFSYCLNFF